LNASTENQYGSPERSAITLHDLPLGEAEILNCVQTVESRTMTGSAPERCEMQRVLSSSVH